MVNPAEPLPLTKVLCCIHQATAVLLPVCICRNCSAAYGSEQSSASERSYLDYQQPANDHVTPQMRMIVCSWLSEVATEFNMQQETLFLSVALLDRFMGDSNVSQRAT